MALHQEKARTIVLYAMFVVLCVAGAVLGMRLLPGIAKEKKA